MEGYLKRWMGLLSRWKRTYFILHDNILVYCNEKGEQIQGSIHLKISSIVLIPDDPLRIIINSGTREIHLRATTIADKIKWVNALRNAQEESFREGEQPPNIEIMDHANNDLENKAILKPVDFKKIDEDLAEIWCTKAYLDETLSMISPFVQKDTPLFEKLEKLQNYGHQLKRQVTNVAKYLESEKQKLYALAKQLENRSTKLGRNFEPLVLTPDKSYNESYKKLKSFNDDGDNNTVFESFLGEENIFYHNAFKRKTSLINNLAELVENNAIQAGDIDLRSILTEYVTKDPEKYRIMAENNVWKSVPTLSSSPLRLKLPYFKDPNQKLNIWSLLKDMIGKDLARFAVPVYLNEPLSMLQRLCEQFEYSELIDSALACKDPCERLAYIMLFAVVPYSSTVGRNNKPFNPMLGETFELYDKIRNFRFLSEQVSHHPPISAGYCDNENFEFWSNTNVKTTFWGASLEVKPLGPAHLKLKKQGDHFIWYKAKTAVQGIILGKMYVDNFGEMTFENYTTKDTGKLILKQRGWGDKGAYETTGVILDRNKRERYKIEGKWNSEFTIINCDTGERKIGWRKNQMCEKSDWQYNLSKFAIELNHLTPELLRKVPVTDSRLRPDQKALEMGLIELAGDEKIRLEEKQRRRRKEYEQSGKIHIAKWFEERTDEITKFKEYYYLGGYWEAREKGKFEDVLDIY